MNYQQSLEYLMELKNPKSATSLNRARQLLSFFGNPQDSLNVIHIAGTNGKGSLACMLNSVLVGANYKTGLFISPFITDFRERIQIDNRFIPEEKVAYYTSRIKEVAEQNCITVGHFDFITVMALCFFADEGCDYVVLETGLGGRFDATNVCAKPVCCAITPISMDHTDILGDTLEKIAFEKAGIIKQSVPIVTCVQQNEVQKVLNSTAQNLSAPITVADKSNVKKLTTSLDGTCFRYFGKEYKLGLCGFHQAENAIIAIEVLKVLNIPHYKIVSGLLTAKHVGRLEVVHKKPLLLLDGAHNIAGATALARFLDEIEFCGTVIFSAMADKDIVGVVKTLLPYAKRFIAVNLPLARAAKNTDIAKIDSRITVKDNLSTALRTANGEDVLISGSLYLISDARREVY